jgi:hypothetical protein
MSTRIRARVGRGGGWASGGSDPTNGTIIRQKLLIAKYFPEIASCYNGTINLLLECPLQVRLPDIVTPPLQWHTNGYERFGITAIELEITPGATKRGSTRQSIRLTASTIWSLRS